MKRNENSVMSLIAQGLILLMLMAWATPCQSQEAEPPPTPAPTLLPTPPDALPPAEPGSSTPDSSQEQMAANTMENNSNSRLSHPVRGLNRRTTIRIPDGYGTAPPEEAIALPDVVAPALPVQTNALAAPPPVPIVPPGRVIIEYPRPNDLIVENRFELFFHTDNRSFTAHGGGSFHIIHNNEAPIVHTDPRKPVIFENLREGGHLIRVFAVDAQGVAQWMPDGYAAVAFFVAKRDYQYATNLSSPYLSINLPLETSTIPDEQGRICFDFFAHNAMIQGGNHYTVRYILNQREEILREPGPIYWNNLAAGRYTLKAELLDPRGQPVLGPLNQVERTFEVIEVRKPINMQIDENPYMENPDLEYLVDPAAPPP